jgi:uncharacterized protein involved in exopolysaccharide biosynthesis
MLSVTEMNDAAQSVDRPLEENTHSGSSPDLWLEFLLHMVYRRGTIARFAAAGAVLGLILAAILPPQFESRAALLPPEQSGSSLLSSALGARGGDVSSIGLATMMGLKSSGALFVGILESRSAEDDLIQKFNLQQRYRSSTLEAARKKLRSLSSFTEERKSGIITVRVRDKNRDEARQMCEEYISVLNRLIEQDGNSTARKEREFLERRLVLANADLTQSERDFSQFGSKNKAISIPDQTKATIEAAANLQGQLVAAEADLNGLRQIYSPENPRIRTAEGRVALVRSKLQEMDGTGSKSASVDSGELIGPSLQQLPSLGVTYADLYRKLKLQEAVLGTLSTEYELARVQEARDIPTVRVLDSPNAPERKIAPSRTLIFLGLTFFSTSAGCLWVFLSSRWQALAPLDGKKLLLRTILSTYQNDFLRIRSFLSIKTRMGMR